MTIRTPEQQYHAAREINRALRGMKSWKLVIEIKEQHTWLSADEEP